MMLLGYVTRVLFLPEPGRLLKFRCPFLAKPEDNEISSVGPATVDLGELVSSVPPSEAQGAT
jgi:hypothetical protein